MGGGVQLRWRGRGAGAGSGRGIDTVHRRDRARPAYRRHARAQSRTLRLRLGVVAVQLRPAHRAQLSSRCRVAPRVVRRAPGGRPDHQGSGPASVETTTPALGSAGTSPCRPATDCTGPSGSYSSTTSCSSTPRATSASYAPSSRRPPPVIVTRLQVSPTTSNAWVSNHCSTARRSSTSDMGGSGPVPL